MPLRERNGKWHYRFQFNGAVYSGDTGLAAIERLQNAAMRIEAEAFKLVQAGKADHLKLQVKPFNDAAEQFLTWARGEYRNHPASAERLAVSFASLTLFFGKLPVCALQQPGRIEDYKAWRRTEHKLPDGTVLRPVKEITLRHDLHALSKFFGYAMKHNWCKSNPVREVEIPSDADAVRMYVISPPEEMVYFNACLNRQKKIRIKGHFRKGRTYIKPHDRSIENDYRDLHDLGRLMILQGCRPEEFLELEQMHVDLEKGTLTITHGKSRAARRTLRLQAESREILARRLGVPGRWVFPSSKLPGQHITKLNNSHNQVLEDAGLPHFVLYDFRHTFATRAADKGMPLPTLAAILGHASTNIRSVMKYIHVSQPSMDAEMRRYEQASQPAEQPKPWKDSDSIN